MITSTIAQFRLYLHQFEPKRLNKKILHLAIPNIISNLSVPLLSVVDTALVGHLPNTWSIGAVAIGSMIFNFVYWGFGFLRMGTTGLTAQALGKEDSLESSLILSRAILVAFIAGILLIIAQTLIAGLSFHLIDASSQVELYARKYFNVRIYAAPATLGLYALIGWFLGMQNARYPMIITLVVNLINVVLDAYFVMILKMDAEGVALGTVIAQYLGLMMGLFFLFRKYPHFIRRFTLAQVSQKEELKRFFKLNSDIFIRTLMLIFTFSFFTAKSAEFGDSILAANSILIQLWMVFSYGIDGFAFAAESIVGMFIGAKDVRKLKRAIRLIFIWGTSLGFGFSVVYFLFDRSIIALFTNQKDIIQLALQFMGWTIIAPLINSFCYIWDGIYIGATASKAMRNSMVLATIGFFIPAYYLGVNLMGNHGMWLAMILFMIVRGISLTLLAKKNIFNFTMNSEQ